jgi:hypothetical protein
MNLEAQCCSLSLAIKLKELGVKYESLFWHIEKPYKYHPQADGTTVTEYKWVVGNPFAFDVDMKNCYSAFTASELGEILGVGFQYSLESFKNSDGMCEAWIVRHNGSIGEIIFSDTEVNGRAKMLIHLIENKLMELPK